MPHWRPHVVWVIWAIRRFLFDELHESLLLEPSGEKMRRLIKTSRDRRPSGDHLRIYCVFCIHGRRKAGDNSYIGVKEIAPCERESVVELWRERPHASSMPAHTEGPCSLLRSSTARSSARSAANWRNLSAVQTSTPSRAVDKTNDDGGEDKKRLYINDENKTTAARASERWLMNAKQARCQLTMILPIVVCCVSTSDQIII